MGHLAPFIMGLIGGAASGAVKTAVASAPKAASRAKRFQQLRKQVARTIRKSKIGRRVSKWQRRASKKIAKSAGWPQAAPSAFFGPAPPADFSKHFDHSNVLANMGDPNAYENEKTRATDASLREHSANERKKIAGAGLAGGAAMASVGATATGGMVAFIAALHLANEAVHKFGNEMVESRRGLARYSGATAAAFAKFDVKQFQLQMQTAQGTSGSTSTLVEAVSNLNEEFQPIQQDLATVMNLASLAVVQVGRFAVWVENIAETVTGARWLIRKAEEYLGGKAPQTSPLSGFIHQMSQNAAKAKARPLPKIH